MSANNHDPQWEDQQDANRFQPPPDQPDRRSLPESSNPNFVHDLAEKDAEELFDLFDPQDDGDPPPPYTTPLDDYVDAALDEEPEAPDPHLETSQSQKTYSPTPASGLNRDELAASQRKTIQQPRPDPDQHLTMDFAPAIQDAYCPHCNTELYARDQNFCQNCGTQLQENLARCRNCNTRLVPEAEFCFHCGAKVEDVPHLKLVLSDLDREYHVPDNTNSFIVGRTVPQQGIYVDLDLSDVGQRRISRQHARFTLRENQWYVEDMNSRAGTRVYNRRLEPFKPQPVEDSMVLYFADLKFKVVFDE